MMVLKLPRGAKLALIIAAVLWFTHRPLTEIAIDWMWFDAAGYIGIFKTSITARAALFGVGALLSAIFIGLNIRFAFKAQPIQADAFRLVSGEVLVDPARMAGLLKVVGWLATLLPALVFGMVASSLWLDVLSFVDRVPFGIEDPVFGHDVSFYVFELPMIAYARSIGVGTVVVTTIATGVYYLSPIHHGHGSRTPVQGRSETPVCVGWASVCICSHGLVAGPLRSAVPA
jgi:uncharacterized membrane protein (UPF0182 family)